MERPDYAATLSHEAHRHHLMLHMGLEKTANVTAWADSMLQRLDHPPSAIIDLSMAQSMTELDLSKLLEPMMKNPRKIEPLRPVFGELARGIVSGTLKVHEVVGNLAEYGVYDTTGSQLLPRDLAQWLNTLVYEMVNIRYVYPTQESLQQGIEDITQDVIGGLHSLAETGRYEYRTRPAVRRALDERIADAKPVPHNRHEKAGGLLDWLRGRKKPS